MAEEGAASVRERMKRGLWNIRVSGLLSAGDLVNNTLAFDNGENEEQWRKSYLKFEA